MIRLAHIAAIAGAEFRTGVRNRWVLLASLVLLAFAGVLAFLGGAPGGAAHIDRLTLTVASLSTLSVYLVPLIALLLSFDAIAGEVDRGTLPLMLATPISRLSVLSGKFIGHLAVIAIAIMFGFGAVGAALAAGSGEVAGLVHLVRLIITSIALGAVFLGVGYFASIVARTSGLAAAIAVGIWLVSVVLYDLALLGALVSDAGGYFSTAIFPWLLVANPADAFRLYNMAALDLGSGATGLSGLSGALPYGAALPVVLLAGWVVLAFALAGLAFRRFEP
jgi:Cu-processing system permease protein